MPKSKYIKLNSLHNQTEKLMSLRKVHRREQSHSHMNSLFRICILVDNFDVLQMLKVTAVFIIISSYTRHTRRKKRYIPFFLNRYGQHLFIILPL